MWKSTVTESHSETEASLSLYLPLIMSPPPYAASAWRCIPYLSHSFLMPAASSMEPKSVLPMVATAQYGYRPAAVSSSSILSNAFRSTLHLSSTGILRTAPYPMPRMCDALSTEK